MAAVTPAPRLSVIVATYNRSASLLRTLDSLAGMTLDSGLWEAVIVDNNSTDDTAEAFARWQQAYPSARNIRMMSEARQGLSHARNRGIGESRGEVIAIIDDDETVGPGFAEDYLSFFDSYPDAAAAGGKMIPVYKGERPVWLSRFTEVPVASAIDLGDRVKPFPRGRNPFGGNMAFRRGTLETAGAFDPALGRTGTSLLAGEEKELFERIRRGGGTVYWVPGPAISHHIPAERLTCDYFRRVTYMGGVSERRRTLGRSRAAFAGRLASEAMKWAACLMLAAGYLLSGHPAKGKYLILMRYYITKGLLAGNKDRTA